MSFYFSRLLRIVLIIIAACGWALAEPSPTPAPSASASGTETAPTPIPLPQVVSALETASAGLQQMVDDVSGEVVTSRIQRDLDGMVSTIQKLEGETKQVLQERPSMDALRTLQASWSALTQQLTTWSKELTARATALGSDVTEVDLMESTWKATLSSARAAGAPAEVLSGVEGLLSRLKAARNQIEGLNSRILLLQNQISQQSGKADGVLSSISRTREEAVDLLFVKDCPALWRLEGRSASVLLHDTWQAVVEQQHALVAYASREAARFVTHLAILAVLTLLLVWARDRVRPMADDPDIRGVMAVFSSPFAVAVLLSLTFSESLYPRGPRLLMALLSGAALLPAVIIIRRLLSRNLVPILNFLVAAYVVDVCCLVLTPVTTVYRVVFAGQMAAAAIFLVYLMRTAPSRDAATEENARYAHRLGVAARFLLVAVCISFLANLLGYLALARLVGNGALDSCYLALLLYGLILVLDGLGVLAMHVRPLSRLIIVGRHEQAIRHRLRQGLTWLGAIFWTLATLDMFSLRTSVTSAIHAVLTTPATVGSLTFTLGGVLACLLALWLGAKISALARFVLDEEVYTRLSLPPGVPYATSTLLHYGVLVLAILCAVGALGIDMTRFTVVVGAFSVGLGFGLQNIFNNFVSGLILLFERPVKVGDMVELKSSTGRLQAIGLRASVVRTLEGSEIIVPNGTLISQEVTNWTLSDQRRRVEMEVGAAYGSSPRQVMALILETARVHPDVSDDPPPSAQMTGLGDNAINFILRVWIDDFPRWADVRSDLYIAIYDALNEAGVGIPFPQRDLHLQTVSDEAARTLRRSADNRGPVARAEVSRVDA